MDAFKQTSADSRQMNFPHFTPENYSETSTGSENCGSAKGHPYNMAILYHLELPWLAPGYVRAAQSALLKLLTALLRPLRRTYAPKQKNVNASFIS